MSRGSFPGILRDGSWLTLGRLRLWVSAVLIASADAWVSR